MIRPTLPAGARFLSLRWKGLILLSLILLMVHGGMAWIANAQFVAQFEQQQIERRAQQARQLAALIRERRDEMSKLATLIPLMTGEGTEGSALDRFNRALDQAGLLLEVEWDIRSMHWVDASRQVRLDWPSGTRALDLARLPARTGALEQTFDWLDCDPFCVQYVATPLIWEGDDGGLLVLTRSLADALLAFRSLTQADVVLVPRNQPTGRPAALTDPERTRPIVEAVFDTLTAPDPSGEPVRWARGGQWFELHPLPELAPGVVAWIIADVTRQREAVLGATRRNLFLGLAGLLLSATLLLLVLRGPLQRLGRLTQVIPLLADNRFETLRRRLPRRDSRLMPGDELDMLTASIVAVTRRMEHLRQEREQARDRLAWLAEHDPLTLLGNRHWFQDELERMVQRARGYRQPGALLLLDLDQFKVINDLSGHTVGDDLLRQVAGELRRLARPGDLVARLGGDEFALALPVATADAARASARRILEAIAALRCEDGERRHAVSVSIGILPFPEHGEDVQQLLAAVELAMYQAKERGPGRWHLFTEADRGRERLHARVHWRERIADALRQDRFVLHAQPIVSVTSGVVSHLEVLLRMRDEHGALVYPGDFIPVAEKTGQIRAIDRWVMTRALAAMQGQPRLALALNLSAQAMEDPALLPELERLLDLYRIEPRHLTLELTETAAMQSLHQATHLMRGIRALGCRFALDDFGSGYASYAYLRQLPLDDIKIDGSFVRDLATSREDRLFVKSITEMAHGMGKRVIAEFVETQAILDILRELGVDLAQGYHVARPAPLVRVMGDLAAARSG